MSLFVDHFSKQADIYLQYRPRYPEELFEYLSQQTKSHDLAWDCATGSGQCAQSLAVYYKLVIGTDASEAQIENAHSERNIEYRVEPAEHSTLDPQSVDLLTVAQGVHWFQLDAFYAEAKRTLKPGGVIAVWCYGFHKTDNHRIQKLYEDYSRYTLKGYWPENNKLVWNHYRDLAFPFHELKDVPKFQMKLSWNFDDFFGYIRTWSATQKLIDAKGIESLRELYQHLLTAWGDPAHRIEFISDLGIRIGMT